MKKKSKLLLGIVIIVLLASGLGAYVIKNKSAKYGDSENDIKNMLIAHYKPGTCYGMPPGRAEPNITLEKEASGWQYMVKDGQCCEITTYEGSVVGEGNSKRIEETRSSADKVPC